MDETWQCVKCQSISLQLWNKTLCIPHNDVNFTINEFWSYLNIYSHNHFAIASGSAMMWSAKQGVSNSLCKVRVLFAWCIKQSTVAAFFIVFIFPTLIKLLSYVKFWEAKHGLESGILLANRSLHVWVPYWLTTLTWQCCGYPIVLQYHDYI